MYIFSTSMFDSNPVSTYFAKIHTVMWRVLDNILLLQLSTTQTSRNVRQGVENHELQASPKALVESSFPC